MSKKEIKELEEKELEKVSGGVQIAQNKCIGCGNCVNAYPAGCIFREKIVYCID